MKGLHQIQITITIMKIPEELMVRGEAGIHGIGIPYLDVNFNRG